jgi:hypothetical protein
VIHFSKQLADKNIFHSDKYLAHYIHFIKIHPSVLVFLRTDTAKLVGAFLLFIIAKALQMISECI